MSIFEDKLPALSPVARARLMSLQAKVLMHGGIVLCFHTLFKMSKGKSFFGTAQSFFSRHPSESVRTVRRYYLSIGSAIYSLVVKYLRYEVNVPKMIVRHPKIRDAMRKLLITVRISSSRSRRETLGSVIAHAHLNLEHYTEREIG